MTIIQIKYLYNSNFLGFIVNCFHLSILISFDLFTTSLFRPQFVCKSGHDIWSLCISTLISLIVWQVKNTKLFSFIFSNVFHFSLTQLLSTFLKILNVEKFRAFLPQSLKKRHLQTWAIDHFLPTKTNIVCSFFV